MEGIERKCAKGYYAKFAALIEKHEGALSELTRITLGAPCASFGKFEVGLAADVSR